MSGAAEVNPGCVFVYGTLRLFPSHPGSALLRGKSNFLGFGTIPGRLFDLGDFPGAIPGGDPHDRLRGEVHQLTEPDQTYPLLDEYEGCGEREPHPHLFRRDTVVAVLDGGPEVECAVYWYGGALSGKRRIRSGEYFANG